LKMNFANANGAIVPVMLDASGCVPVTVVSGGVGAPPLPVGGPLTDDELRAAPVATADAAAVAALEALRLQLVTLLGNTDGVEALQQNAIDILTLTNGYVDGLESLVTTLGENTDGLEGLLSTITGHVDALEPLLQDLKDLSTADATKQDAILLELGAIKAKLLLDKGQAAAAGSLSVVLASDSDHATRDKQDALAVIVDAVLTRLNAGVRDLVTDSTGAAFDLHACSILPTWDASGNLISETATNSAGTWIRTHSTNPAGLPGLTSNWVKQ
jgi:hypothetical protein